MRYHNITTADMLNGTGLRVVLWLSGCDHHCENCQNPQTHDINSGIEFDLSAKEELFRELEKNYIKGVTFSGGDPLHKNNIYGVLSLCKTIKKDYQQKDIWLYSGFTWEELFNFNDGIDEENWCVNEIRKEIVSLSDVFVDGRYWESCRDTKLMWRGSSNQRVIDVQRTLKENKIILYCE